MNPLDLLGGSEAVLKYLDGDIEVIKPGSHVICACSGARIPLERLRYWSVDRQEAYATPDLAVSAMYPEVMTNRNSTTGEQGL